MSCARQTVRCLLLTRDDRAITGQNDCANPQAVCPRAAGEGYEKCLTICQQGGHAEIQAIESARMAGADLTGATAVIYGHYWACEPCARALRDAGVTEIRIHLEGTRRA